MLTDKTHMRTHTLTHMHTHTYSYTHGTAHSHSYTQRTHTETCTHGDMYRWVSETSLFGIQGESGLRRPLFHLPCLGPHTLVKDLTLRFY